ncbi:hypothetical protein GCM10027614_42970 [Micromonospora vulcania]
MVAALVALGLAAPAQAGQDADACTNYGCAGMGSWYGDGDQIVVCDLEADGWSVVVIAWLNGVRASNKWHTAGAGSCSTRSYGDLPEGMEVKFQACLGKYSSETGDINRWKPGAGRA